jgi:hypothetical protein
VCSSRIEAETSKFRAQHEDVSFACIVGRFPDVGPIPYSLNADKAHRRHELLHGKPDKRTKVLLTA